MGSRTRMGLQDLAPTTQTQTSDINYNHLTLDPVTPDAQQAPSPSPTTCALFWSWVFSVQI